MTLNLIMASTGETLGDEELQSSLATLSISPPNYISGPNLFLDRIISNDLLYGLIFDASSAASLVHLLKTCHALNIAVRDYMKRAFDISNYLSRYFPNPPSFRLLQRSTGTIISGSTALQFFDRSYYPESDLDLYVPLCWRHQVGNYLLEQGYTFVPNSRQDRDFGVAVMNKRVLTNKAIYGNFKGIAAVFTFSKDVPERGKLKVQVIAAVRSPTEVVLRFHSSKSKLQSGFNAPSKIP